MQVKNTFTTELINLFINKPNRNGDLYHPNRSIVDFNIEQLEYAILPKSNLSFVTFNTKQSYPTDLVNTPRNLVNTIPETLNIPHQDIIRNLSEELLSQKNSLTPYLKQ